MALTQRQLKAIFAQNRSKGLRQTIQALRKKKHKASDWRTLFHITPEQNVDSIMRRGIIPKGGKGYFHRKPYYVQNARSKQKTTWLGTRATIPMMHVELLYEGGYDKTRVMKVRVPKKGLQIDDPDYGVGAGKEYITQKRIPPDNIRKIGNMADMFKRFKKRVR